jgi:preprotein translocase SecE subunit
MKRVTWPPWKQVRATTAVVIVAVFAFAGYFAVVDAIFGRAIQKLFDTFTK